MSTRLCAVLGLLLVSNTGQVQPCRAERKPPPPQRAKPERMPTAEFLRTYEQLDYPKLVLSVTMDEGGSEEHRVALEARLKAGFQDDQGEVTIINPDYTRLRQDHDYDNLIGNDAPAAAELLRKEYEADIVVLLRLIPTGAVGYGGSYVVIDCARGHELGNYSFNVEPAGDTGLTVRRLAKYADQIAARIARDLKKFAGPTRKYALRFVDLDAQLERNLRNELKAMPEMKHVKFRSQERGWGNSVSLFDVRYRGEDVLDLREDVREVLEDLTGQPVEAWRSNEGTITLAVLAPPPVSMHDVFGGAGNPAIDAGTRAEFLARLRDAYLRKGEPRIAIILNEPAPPGDRIGAGERIGAKGGERAPGEVMTESRMEQQFRNELNNELLDRLTSLKLNAVELYQAYVNERSEREKQEAMFDEVELAMLIASNKECELLILGTGTFVSDENNFAVRYTMRAFNTRDARIIGAAHGDATVPTNSERNVQLNKARDEIAGDCVGPLVFRMLRAWEPPQKIRIEVSNVKSIGGLKAVAEWMRTNLGKHVLYTIEGPFQEGDKSGLGSFEIVYGTDYRSFTDALVNAAPAARFTLDNQRTTREIIHIRAMSN